MPIELTLNGETVTLEIDPRTPLLDVLRDRQRLTGAKAVCREGFCGACTVHIDGEAVPSCLRPIGLLYGCSIVTVEGLAPPGTLNRVQQALIDHDVVQCGMCFPGMVMTLTDFLDREPNPDRDQIKASLVGNICRCTGYERIIDAVLSIHAEGAA
ncbi:CoxS Aerobic-type carbon monoxide dehydrogenase, small subunit CoxS/CutS homologs [Paracoccaceae bacterium]